MAVGHAADAALGARADRRAHGQKGAGSARSRTRRPMKAAARRPSRRPRRRSRRRADSVSVSRPSPRRAASEQTNAATITRTRRAAASRRSPRAARVNVRVAVEVIPNALSDAATLASLVEEQLDGLDVGVCLDYGHAHLMGDLGEAVEDALRPPVDDARPRQRREARRPSRPYAGDDRLGRGDDGDAEDRLRRRPDVRGRRHRRSVDVLRRCVKARERLEKTFVTVVDVLERLCARRARKRNHVPDVAHARGVDDRALEAEAEAGVRHGPVAAQVAIPPVVFGSRCISASRRSR